MENITGKAVTHKNYLETRLYLVDELKELVRKHSVIIEAPRRFGKTSVIKEFIRQEDEKTEQLTEFNILFLELEGEETIDNFCFKLFKEILNLYFLRKQSERIGRIIGSSWNAVASRIGKIQIPEFEIELREKTRDHDFSEWKEKISPLIDGLNSLKRNTIIVFDEFPDMLANFRKEAVSPDEFRNLTDLLTGWLRTLRQNPDSECKYQFVFCGSINLRKTLEQIGMSKRINDLESFSIPPMSGHEAEVLIGSLCEEYHMEVDPEGTGFLIEKITNGSPYYGQILIKALRETREASFSVSMVKAVYERMLRSGSHDLNHFHSRLEEHLSPLGREIASRILGDLCREACHEQKIYQTVFHEKCSFEAFQSVVDRLEYEGYLTRDIKDDNNLRFVSPLLRDWWACKIGAF